MQKLSFFKFHGAGNDFIMVDNRAGSIVLTPQQIAHICHRRLGVGADGLIMLDSCDCADFAMHYYNADGSDSMLCGNGSRCVSAMANMLGVIDREGDFLASDGIHHAVVDAREDNRWQITIEIKDVDKVTDYADGSFVNTGAPHFVRRVNNIADYPIVKEGRAIRYDERFQGGTNANFIVPEGEGIRVRTYERGVEDETLSCGTGVTASAIIWGHLQQWPDGRYAIPVRTLGGDFTISYDKQEDSYRNILLSGPVTWAFSGEIDV